MFSVRTLLTSLVAISLVPFAYAGAIQARSETSVSEPVPVTANIDEFSLAAGLTQQTYCPHVKNGMKVGDAELLWHYGDGNFVQKALIYHSKKLGIVVAYQGTNTTSILSDLHDVVFFPDEPNHRYKKGLPEGTKLAAGFQASYIDVVDLVMEHVRKFMSQKGEDRVSIVGHSLGASMGLISAADFNYRLKDHLHRIYLFGLPRTGNPIFADFVDRELGKKLHWAVNGKDWVPHVPPRLLGFQNPSNAIWINPANSTNWKMYPGQENVHGYDSVVLPEYGIFDDHQGVYFHTQIGASKGHCPATVGQD